MYAAKAAGKNRYVVFEPHMHDRVVERLRDRHGAAAGAAARRARRCTTSRSSDSPTARSAASRRWCAGSIPRRGLVLPGAVHPDRRGERPDRAHRPLGARRGVPAGAGVAGPTGAGLHDQRQPVRAAAAEPGGRRRRARRPRPQRPGPGRLTLEITESILMSDTAESLDRLRALKDLGVQISIDDFGTGYSSLSYLRRFPVDVLKVDKSFVDDLRRARGGHVGLRHGDRPAGTHAAAQDGGRRHRARGPAPGAAHDRMRLRPGLPVRPPPATGGGRRAAHRPVGYRGTARTAGDVRVTPARARTGRRAVPRRSAGALDRGSSGPRGDGPGGRRRADRRGTVRR